ncbi:hypothetical protein [Amycolatopsis pithecellobii]|uniref:Uncharacterized protein n=1 Tax=Amycolatopsis pithecellobii TaxID=664692 RepID=A0A6N7Z5C6_9PSEU|nr:hypothetical protein [Amycolatopsis pithecellobii]MTD55700.1 hypothetical protein [Amycolatopsis pithecellobii]
MSARPKPPLTDAKVHELVLAAADHRCQLRYAGCNRTAKRVVRVMIDWGDGSATPTRQAACDRCATAQPVSAAS